MATTIPPVDNVDVDQKKGDHLTVILCAAAVIAIHVVAYIFWPAYVAETLKAGWYYVVDGILLLGCIVSSVIVWKMTFENYLPWKLTSLILFTVFTLIVTLWAGRKAQDRVDNGFDVLPTTQSAK